MARRALPRLVRIGLWSLAGLVVLVAAGAAVVAVTFDPDSLKPRIVAAVKQATGRDLTIAGHLRLGLSLRPTLVAQGVSLANPPGFSRPQMATLERLDAELALLPLLHHRVEIDRLVLLKPDIILETDAQGRPNWQFTPQARPAGTPSSATGGASDGAATRLSAADVRIEDGTVTWRDGRTNRSAVLGVASLRATAPSPDADLTLSLSATYDAAPFTLTGRFGPLAVLQGSAASGWPVQARLEAAGARLDVGGSIAQPMQARGYRLKVAATVPDLAALAVFAPGAHLPPLRDVVLAAEVTDAGAAWPEVSGLTLHIGASELSGLRIEQVDVTAPRLDQPVQLSAKGEFAGVPATVTGSTGALAALLAGRASGPVPLDLVIHALGSNLTVKGTAARGADGRASVQAAAAAEKVDLDVLLAALHRPPPPAGAAPAAPPPAPAAAPAQAAAGHVIPDTPIPLATLHLADADVKLSIAELAWGGGTYRGITTHIDLHGGRLRLDPLSADLPEGHIDAALSVDASQPTPVVALRLQSAALAVQTVLAALRQPAYVSGTMQVHADLHGTGATLHAIASSLDGSATLSMGGGSIDNRLLGSTLGSVLRTVNLLDLVGRGGASEIRCFAAHIDASHGIAALRSFVFASSLLSMDGGGSVNLGAETLDLHIRPQARLAGTGIVVPMRISGPWRAPATVPDASAVAGNAGAMAGALLGNATPLGMIAGALGGKQILGGSGECGAAPAAQGPPQQAPPKPPNLGSVLKQLLR